MSSDEKLERCPRCDNRPLWRYEEQICGACDYGNRVAKQKDVDRALHAIAGELCATHFTDGFCSPRDGKCVGQKGERPAHRNCMTKALGCFQSMCSRGIKPVWVFNKDPR